jgi:thiamine pyrophosphate-dependent acetolactate synthase large subunit-like protein
MQVAEAMAFEIKRQNVRAVFTLMSEETAKLVVHLTQLGVAVYHTRHDSTAIGMADGYSRACGEIGVAIVGRGPGLTNSLNTLITAAKGSTKLLVLTGDSAADQGVRSPASFERIGKYIDQGALLGATNIKHVNLNFPASAVADLAASFDRVRRGGSIAVNVPSDVFDAAAGSAASTLDDHERAELSRHPNRADISMVADLVGTTWAARRPLILAGGGAVASGCRDELVRIGELTGGLLGNTLLANSIFRSEEFDVGVIGTLATPLALELIAETDLVLAFGASLNRLTTYGGELFKRARVVQFDSDPDAFGRYQPTEVNVLGDARLSAAVLAEELIRRGHHGTGYRTIETAATIRNFRLDDTFSDRGRAGALDPRAVMSAIDKVLPQERTLVVDGGHHLEFSIAHISVPDPAGFVFPIEYFSVGCGLASALGAAVARPDRLTVLDVGDGGLMMNLGDLDTAVRYGLRLVVLVSNDSAFGSEVHFLQLAGLPDDAARYSNPSFEAVGRSLGLNAITVESIADVEKLRGALVGLSIPLLVDCKFTTEVRAGWVDLMFGSSPDRGTPSESRQAQQLN